jgi:hypothetical protein
MVLALARLAEAMRVVPRSLMVNAFIVYVWGVLEARND